MMSRVCVSLSNQEGVSVDSKQIVNHTESHFQSQDAPIDLVDHMDCYINRGTDRPWLSLLERRSSARRQGLPIVHENITELG